MQPAALLPAHKILSGIIDSWAMRISPNGECFAPVFATLVLPLFFAVSNSFLIITLPYCFGVSIIANRPEYTSALTPWYLRPWRLRPSAFFICLLAARLRPALFVYIYARSSRPRELRLGGAGQKKWGLVAPDTCVPANTGAPAKRVFSINNQHPI